MLRGWKFERRRDRSSSLIIIYKIIAIVVALILTGIFIELSGKSALDLGKRVIQSTLGSSYGLQQLGILATPLIITGAAVMLGGRLGLWNVGVEGQLFMGAWAATAVGLYFTGPSWVGLVLMFIAGGLAGAVWVFIPAYLRIKAKINEILTTLLFNFIAFLIVDYFLIKYWTDPSQASLNVSRRILFELPVLFGSLNIGILIAILISVFLAIIIGNTVWGYEINSIGSNRRAAEFAGMQVNKYMFLIMMISGAIAGIAGVIELAGTTHRLSSSISAGYGWDGFLVGILAADGSPLGLIPFGLIIALLLNGGIVLQVQGLSDFAVLAIIGLILLFVSIGEVIADYRFVRVIESSIKKNSNVPDENNISIK
jgi:simple sugar transport system permease protein